MSKSGTTVGPMPESDVKRGIDSGHLKPGMHIRDAEGGQWMPIEQSPFGSRFSGVANHQPDPTVTRARVWLLVSVLGAGAFLLHVKRSWDEHQEKEGVSEQVRQDANSPATRETDQALEARAGRISEGQSAADQARAEQARWLSGKRLFDAPTDASCTLKDAAKHLVALKELRAQVDACSVPRDLSVAPTCMAVLGKNHEITGWVIEQMEGLPQPTWPRSSVDAAADTIVIGAKVRTCCSCSPDAPAACVEAGDALSRARQNLHAWMNEIGTRSDDECLLATAQRAFL